MADCEAGRRRVGGGSDSRVEVGDKLVGAVGFAGGRIAGDEDELVVISESVRWVEA